MKKTQKKQPNNNSNNNNKNASPFRRQLSPIWAFTPFLQEHLEP